MESVLNVSFLGSLLLVLTTLRLTWLMGIAENADKAKVFLTAIHHKFENWLRSAYKPFTVLVISALTLSACYAATGDRYLEVWHIAMIFGLVSVGLGVLFTMVIADLQRMLHISVIRNEGEAYPLTAGKALVTVRNLIICLICVLLVLLRQPYQKWGLFPTLSLLAGFAMGASSALLIAYLYRSPPVLPQETPNWVTRLLKPHRLDTLAGAIAATMLLGAGLSEVSTIGIPQWAAGPVMLPLLLAVNGIVVSSAIALLSGGHYYHLLLSYRSLPQKLLNALLVGGISLILVKYMLANHWVLNGKEYQGLHIYYAVLAGIVGGLLFHEVGSIYRYWRERYHTYIQVFTSEEHFAFKSLRVMFRTIYRLVPPVVAALFFLKAHDYVGLYGIMLALVAMLSNLTTRFGAAFRIS